jgi:hypothetical protein
MFRFTQHRRLTITVIIIMPLLLLLLLITTHGFAFPIFSIASAPEGGYLKEAIYTISGGLLV